MEPLDLVVLVVGGVVAGVIGTAGGITSLVAYPVLLAVGGVGIDRFLDAGQDALEDSNYDGRADAVADAASLSRGDLFQMIYDDPECRAELRWPADGDSQKIRDLDDLEKYLADYKKSGDEGVTARAALDEFAANQGTGMTNLVDN